ncbi:unnamed protein product [Callosobruchus maculatus]|uniref:RING-type domain-containing protein n=1 Tax=Callosobruchus maculatus TaxID=64391 RepID=A0A653BEM7_CALMS|nr:unnamed protein product [Callosobruchus maculatus]
MAEAMDVIDVEQSSFGAYAERVLIDTFPNLCPKMIGGLVRSKEMDLVQLVTHLSGLDDKVQRKTITEEARALMQKVEKAEVNIASKQKSSQVKKYTTEFNVEEFVALIPNPEETFSKPTRGTAARLKNLYYVERYFMNRYPSIYKAVISNMILKYGHDSEKSEECHTLVKIDDQLASAEERGLHTMKCRRKPTLLTLPKEVDILMLQEVAYIEHRKEILDYIQKKKQDEAQRRQYLIDNGLTVTCQCCFTEGLTIEEAFTCNKDCSFCAECIQKSCELKLGEDNIQFPCLADCGSQFAWTTLQAALPPTLFSKLSQRCTESEIRAAGIKLDSCPSCNFTNIIDEQYTTFQCLNPDCMEETCILCKEPSHLPLRCDEVEKDEEVKARLHVEKKMTEALLRTCWRCSRRFIKEQDGCNKITCVCGAMSCYICNKPVESYAHFNGLGGDKYHLRTYRFRCPLYSDMDAMHEREIAKAAEEAKKEVDPAKLKFDPSADINKYYEDKRKKTNPPRWMEALEDVRLARGEQRLEQMRAEIQNLREQYFRLLQQAQELRQIPLHRPPVAWNIDPPVGHRAAPLQRLRDIREQRQVRIAVRRQDPAPAQPPAPAQNEADRPAIQPAQGQPQIPQHIPPPAQPQPAPLELPAQLLHSPPVAIPAEHRPAPVQRLGDIREQRQVPIPVQRQNPAPAQPPAPAPNEERVRRTLLGVPRPTERAPQVNNIRPGVAQVQAAGQAQARKPTGAIPRRSVLNVAAVPSPRRVTKRTSTHKPVVEEQPKPAQVPVRANAAANQPTGAIPKHVQVQPAKSSERGAKAPTTRANRGLIQKKLF